MRFRGFQNNFLREKRQVDDDGDIHAAEKSGVHVFDYAYGVDMKNNPLHLSVYPTLMGEDHNQLGILRPSNKVEETKPVNSDKDNQSAYAKVKQLKVRFQIIIFYS